MPDPGSRTGETPTDARTGETPTDGPGPGRPDRHLDWEHAWQEALYGPTGFYRCQEGPAGHFRTAGHAAPGPLASCLAALARDTGCGLLVDVGAGRGELLTALASADPRLDLHGIDVVARPEGLPPGVGWSVGAESLAEVLRRRGTATPVMVVAWELLDVIPCPVLEADGDGVPRRVLVDLSTGCESLGEPAGPADLAWCERWWPHGGTPVEPGTRWEVGRPRDAVWARLVAAVAGAGSGLLLGVDYAHLPETPVADVTPAALAALAGHPPHGSLAAFRRGWPVPPVPDGSCDITAHVALHAVADAGRSAGATASLVTTQREALRALGVAGTAGLPLRARLERAGQVSELTDPGGLGGFGWLLQSVGLDAALESFRGTVASTQDPMPGGGRSPW